jgi:hypothetical protein
VNHPANTTHLHLIEPVADRNDAAWPEHRDVTPAPQPIRNGQVVTVCACGREFVGVDPDHADWQLFEHTDNTAKTAN